MDDKQLWLDCCAALGTKQNFVNVLSLSLFSTVQVSSKDEDFLDLSVDVEQNTSITHCLRYANAHAPIYTHFDYTLQTSIASVQYYNYYGNIIVSNINLCVCLQGLQQHRNVMQ